ncbi:MAG: GyrI-like domain-containing protein [Chloroflexi bacterium]|nr:GyrI-like domain-containing protein [Chloroflexota bacterium]
MLHLRQLPAVEAMASTVVSGGLEALHAGYGRMALWGQANGYRLAGLPREMLLKAPEADDGQDMVTELQFPIEASR